MAKRRIPGRYRFLLWKLAAIAGVAALLLFAFSRIAMQATEIPAERLARADAELPVKRPASVAAATVAAAPGPAVDSAASTASAKLAIARSYWEWLETYDPEKLNDPKISAWRGLMGNPDWAYSQRMLSDRVGTTLELKKGNAVDRSMILNFMDDLKAFHARHAKEMELLDTMLDGEPIDWPAPETGIPVGADGGPLQPDPQERIAAIGQSLILADAAANSKDGAALARDVERLVRLDRRVTIEYPFFRPPGNDVMSTLVARELAGEEGLGLFDSARFAPGDAAAFLERAPAPELETLSRARELLRGQFEVDRYVAADARIDRQSYSSPIDLPLPDSFYRRGIGAYLNYLFHQVVDPVSYPVYRADRFESLVALQKELDAGLERMDGEAGAAGMKDEATEIGFRQIYSDLNRSRAYQRDFRSASQYGDAIFSLRGMHGRNAKRLMIYAAMTARAGAADPDRGLARLQAFSRDFAGGRLSVVVGDQGLLLRVEPLSMVVPNGNP